GDPEVPPETVVVEVHLRKVGWNFSHVVDETLCVVGGLSLEHHDIFRVLDCLIDIHETVFHEPEHSYPLVVVQCSKLVDHHEVRPEIPVVHFHGLEELLLDGVPINEVDLV